MKRLYRVDFSGECYVLAETEAEACETALRACTDPDGAGLDADATLVKRGDALPWEWPEGLPYGQDRGAPELTVRQIMDSMPEDDGGET